MSRSRCTWPSRRRISIHSSPSRLATSALPSVGGEAEVADRGDRQVAHGPQRPARPAHEQAHAAARVAAQDDEMIAGRGVAAGERGSLHGEPLQALPGHAVERDARRIQNREPAAVGGAS